MNQWHSADTGCRFRAQSPPGVTTTSLTCQRSMPLPYSPFLLLDVQSLKVAQKHHLAGFPLRTMPHGHAGATDLTEKKSSAERLGKTTKHYMGSLTMRRWERTNRFPKQITADQFVRIISMVEGSGKCDTSRLKTALDTILYKFHMSKMRK